MNLKITIIHNKYKIAGGEDSVVNNEKLLLKCNNNEIKTSLVSNDTINGFFSKALAFLQTPFVWSHQRFITTKIIAKKQKPDIVHVHNYFPLLSPSIFGALKRHKLPVVHTLHNYRSVCPTALLMHKGELEERSVTNTCWWAIKEKVYRDSYIGTFALCCMIELHKKLGTWHKNVDAYIALTEFSRNKFIDAGWPAEKIQVKPNFVEDKFSGRTTIEKKGGYGIYVGRLSKEKGISTLLSAWRSIDYPLKIVGDGPLIDLVNESTNENIDYLGKCSSDKVIEEIQHADFIVLPSLCYEGFPMVLVEAFCCGTPAIVSGIGSMEEIVKSGQTGIHFSVGNSEDLSAKVERLLSNKTKLTKMAKNSRREYLEKYTADCNYRQLMHIYQSAITNSSLHCNNKGTK
ncbi:MAG: glycosyltransferase family 4 protein [Colwellia sp.]